VAESDQRWTEEDGVTRREIIKVSKVIEVSVVNFPAYAGTNIDARSLDSDKRALENARRLLDSRTKKQAINPKANAIMTMYKGAKTK
jgi:phage head maturation protease